MDLAHQLILVAAGLIFLSIFAGLVSSRIGAPLLLVFLGLGMLAGKEGPGGIVFDDFQAAYMIGAAALALILFDGGLRTSKETVRLASWPALVLATVGVLVTAALTGAVAMVLLDVTWLEGLLAGSIVASTDAAAVFFLLNLRGTNLVRRVSATVEVESGLNDPMAVFLTVTCVELLRGGLPAATWATALDFAGVFTLQLLGGAAIGLAGGYALLRLINALRIAAGLYPILALSVALILFAGAQTIGASGFLAAYLAGVVLGTRRHRATQVIDRFQDGIAWLAQIGMFLMLGLLVTPSELMQGIWVSLAIAAFLLLVGRPVAVVACLLPFRFSWRERAFVAWVGLRGGVPIFLGIVPILADLPNAHRFFEIAFVVVLSSLLIQGWTVTLAARRLNLALPPSPEAPQRVEMDLPDERGRDMVTYAVQEGSAAAKRAPADLPTTAETSLIAVLRDGAMRQPPEIEALYPGDWVMLVAPSEDLAQLDRVFGRPPTPDRQGRDEAVLGEFAFAGDIALSALSEMYDVPIPAPTAAQTADGFLRQHLGGKPVVGDRLRLGTIELIVRAVADGRITQVGVELDPAPLPALRKHVLLIWWRHLRDRLLRRRRPA
jgi:cell volume regulation protein A